MAERRSKIVLEAEAKGFDKAERAAGKMKDALDVRKQTLGYTDLQKIVATINATIQRTSASAKVLDSSFDLKTKTRDAQGLVQALKGVADAVDTIEKKRAQQQRGVDGRWMAQGRAGYGGSGSNFWPTPEDPTSSGQPEDAQKKGGVGGVFSEYGGKAMRYQWRSPVWTGSEGVLRGLSGIPVVGAALAGGLGASLGMSQEYLQYAQARQGAGAYSGLGDRYTPYTPAKPERTTDDIFSDDVLDNLPNHRVIATKVPKSSRRSAAGRRMGGVFNDAPTEKQLAVDGEDESRSINPLAYLTSSGLDFGMNQIEALQFAQSIAQTSGGTLQSVDDTMFRKAAAAQSGFGIGGDVAGAFQRGDRLGAGGGGASGFEKQIERGLKLGLNGSDLQRYMRDTASALMQFEQNGMPLDVEALGATQGSMAAAFGANRGNAVASGFLQAGRGLASSGAQSATQFQLLQDVYGYKGGGVDDYFDAVQRAEKGQAGDLGGFMKNLTVGGTSTKSKALILKSRLQQSLGVNIGTDEALRIADGDMTAFQGALDKAAKLTDGYSLESRGAANVDGNVRRQKGQENTRMGVGARMITATQDFEDASINAARSMSNFDVALQAFSGIVKDRSGDLERLMEIVGNFVNGLVPSGKGGG